MSALQHMDALDKANEIRLARSDAKHRIFAGELSIADAFSLECCQGMTVMELLCSQWRWGRSSTLRVLSVLRISEMCRVRDLTERQCRLLAEACKPKRRRDA